MKSINIFLNLNLNSILLLKSRCYSLYFHPSRGAISCAKLVWFPCDHAIWYFLINFGISHFLQSKTTEYTIICSIYIYLHDMKKNWIWDHSYALFLQYNRKERVTQCMSTCIWCICWKTICAEGGTQASQMPFLLQTSSNSQLRRYLSRSSYFFQTQSPPQELNSKKEVASSLFCI